MPDQETAVETQGIYNQEGIMPRVTSGNIDTGIRAPETINPNKIRNIEIRQLNFGYIVQVGCHGFAIETADRLIQKLSEYLQAPQATEEKWFKGELL